MTVITTLAKMAVHVGPIAEPMVTCALVQKATLAQSVKQVSIVNVISMSQSSTF